MDTQTRQTAIKTKISHLLNGSYVLKEGWEPNYILYEGKKISRVNILGVVVSKNQSELSNNISLVIDDGSGRISVRSFEDNPSIAKSAVGEVIMVIGRPREYNREIYVVPEIIRGVENKRWVEVRKLELGMIHSRGHQEEREAAEKKEPVQAENSSDGKEAPANSQDDVLEIIRKLDSGEGADLDEVVASVKESNPEDLIKNLLKNGDIFELKPGRIKVLE